MKFNIQKPLASFLFLFALLFIQSPQITAAEGMGNYYATTTNANCSDYYNLDGIGIDIKAGVVQAIAGSEVSFSGDLTNNNKYPIVNGKLYAKIFRKRSVSDNNGPDTLDAFVVKDKITLKAGEKIDIKFKWKIPSVALGGDYKLATYFISNDKFDLAGLNYTDTSVGDLSSFIVKSQQSQPNLGVLFKKDGIKINNKAYYGVNYTPIEPSVGPVEVMIPITNTTKIRQSVKTDINVYKWDNQSLENKIDTFSQDVIIEPGKTVNIPIKIRDTASAVYYVESVLKYKDSKSILGVRFIRGGVNMAKINFPSIASYPLVFGKENKISSCFYNASTNNIPIDGKLRIEITDSDGDSILSYEYDGKVTPKMDAVAQNFIPDATYKDFKIHATLFSGSKIVDEVTIPYVCSEIDPTNCGFSMGELTSSKWVRWLLYVLGVLVLLALIMFIINIYGKRKISLQDIVKNNLEMFVFLFLLTAAFSIYSVASVYANVDENFPDCPIGSPSDSGSNTGEMKITSITSTTTSTVTHDDICNDKSDATVNRCGASNVSTTTVNGVNLMKIISVKFASWPVTISGRTSTSAKFVQQRKSESTGDTYFVITYASTSLTGLPQLKCKKKFNFVCEKPVFNSIDPTEQLTSDHDAEATISGQNLRNLYTIKMGHVTVRYPFTSFSTDGDSTVTFKTPREGAGIKDVGGTSICWDEDVDEMSDAYEYTADRGVGVDWTVSDNTHLRPRPIPSNPWVLWRLFPSTTTTPTYKPDPVIIPPPSDDDNNGLHYFTYTSDVDLAGVWNYAIPLTRANIDYESTVTADNNVLQSGETIPVGIQLHFNFDKFTDNRNINWNIIGGTGNTYGGSWYKDAIYPTSSVCTLPNLFASRINHVDPITKATTSDISVYVPFAVNPPNSKLAFGKDGILNISTILNSTYPDWGAPPMLSTDSGSWDCSSSTTALVNPDICTPISIGAKNIYMYYAPTYGYFNYGWQKYSSTASTPCNTNEVPLHKKTAMLVNQSTENTVVGTTTCVPGTFGCIGKFVLKNGTSVGCFVTNPYYNIDTNKCYASFSDYLASKHTDLAVTDTNDALLNDQTKNYYYPYQLKFSESVYTLNLNVIAKSTTTSTSTKPQNPIISGPTRVVVNNTTEYGAVSATTTIKYARGIFDGMLGMVIDVFKKVFAQEVIPTPNVKYIFDFSGNGTTSYYTSDAVEYGLVSTTSFSWSDVGLKTFRVMAEDPQTLATSSWVSYNVNVVSELESPGTLTAPSLTGETCGDKIKLTWTPVINATSYELYKTTPELVESFESTILSTTLDYVDGDSYYIYAKQILDPIISTTTSMVLESWAEIINQKNWTSITSSADGTKLFAVDASPGYIYKSTDSGTTWNQQSNSGLHKWSSITSSADGIKLAAVDNNGGSVGYIYTSTTSATRWTARSSAGLHDWRSITSSSDGTKLAAVSFDDYLMVSTDSGVNWTRKLAGISADWTSITSSSDGTRLVAVANSGFVYKSIDSGSNWVEISSETLASAAKAWTSVTSNANGSQIVLVGQSTPIYISTDYGNSWIDLRNVSGIKNWSSVTSDDSGTYLAAIVRDSGRIYTSTDGGEIWTSSLVPKDYRSITSSSDGLKIVAAAYNFGFIKNTYTSTTTVTTTERDPIISDQGFLDSSIPAGTWCNSTSTPVGIKSGVKFYAKPPWTQTNTCNFFGDIGPVIVGTDDVEYPGVVVNSCKIDTTNQSAEEDPSVPHKYSFANVLKTIGTHTLKCNVTYDVIEGGVITSTSTTDFSKEAKCSRVPDIKEK